MNYKLAKKLKNIGFIQRKHWNENGIRNDWKPNDQENMVSNPNLSELIKECGRYFYILHYDNNTETWYAWKTRNVGVSGNFFDMFRYDNNTGTYYAWRSIEDVGVSGKGKTPEEAVANLWLIIHNDTCKT